MWTRAIGNELGLTEMSYRAALGRAVGAEARVKAGNATAGDLKHSTWLRAIHKDVEESTWEDLKIFQAGAPLHHSLVDVLSAYAMYRSDIGYVTGCNVSYITSGNWFTSCKDLTDPRVRRLLLCSSLTFQLHQMPSLLWLTF